MKEGEKIRQFDDVMFLQQSMVEQIFEEEYVVANIILFLTQIQ